MKADYNYTTILVLIKTKYVCITRRSIFIQYRVIPVSNIHTYWYLNFIYFLAPWAKARLYWYLSRYYKILLKYYTPYNIQYRKRTWSLWKTLIIFGVFRPFCYRYFRRMFYYLHHAVLVGLWTFFFVIREQK